MNCAAWRKKKSLNFDLDCFLFYVKLKKKNERKENQIFKTKNKQTKNCLTLTKDWSSS